jgi:hypothetical protein
LLVLAEPWFQCLLESCFSLSLGKKVLIHKKKKKKKMKKGRKDHTCVEERREDLLEGENGGKMKINRAWARVGRKKREKKERGEKQKN